MYCKSIEVKRSVLLFISTSLWSEEMILKCACFSAGSISNSSSGHRLSSLSMSIATDISSLSIWIRSLGNFTLFIPIERIIMRRSSSLSLLSENIGSLVQNRLTYCLSRNRVISNATPTPDRCHLFVVSPLLDVRVRKKFGLLTVFFLPSMPFVILYRLF